MRQIKGATMPKVEAESLQCRVRYLGDMAELYAPNEDFTALRVRYATVVGGRQINAGYILGLPAKKSDFCRIRRKAREAFLAHIEVTP